MNWRMAMMAAVVLVGLAGCNRMRGVPQYAGPGPASYQQAQAQQYDVYPDPDIGPEVVGARPREYAEPRAEPTRARWTRPLSWIGF